MNVIQIPEKCNKVLKTLQEAGFQAFVVGGCVRDSFLGRTPHDWDISTSAEPQKVMNLFKDRQVIPTGLQHGTVTVMVEEEPFEVTTFRTEGEYSDGRHPDKVSFVEDVEADLSRRDFTINAMAYSESTGLIDPFGGQKDLKDRTIRCVGDPKRRFEEDHLRLLRAIRFSAQLGFSIEAETAQAIEKLSSRIHFASAERIGWEFLKTVKSRHAAEVFRTPAGKKMLIAIAPVFGLMDGCQQNNKYHCADVFEHTMLALENSWTCSDFPLEWADEAVRMALLFHDTGKPFTKTTDENGFDHFYGHPAKSAEITGTTLRRLRFPRSFIEKVVTLVEMHDAVFSATRRSAGRILRQLGKEDTFRLLKIRECDSRAHAKINYARFEAEDKPAKDMILQMLQEESAFSLKQLAVDGYDVMEALGLSSGKEVGRILKALLEEVVDGTLANEKEILLVEAKKLK